MVVISHPADKLRSRTGLGQTAAPRCLATSFEGLSLCCCGRRGRQEEPGRLSHAGQDQAITLHWLGDDFDHAAVFAILDRTPPDLKTHTNHARHTPDREKTNPNLKILP